jgi:NADH:ubiquinone oxidoreductase subunit 6 (subunit J)
MADTFLGCFILTLALILWRVTHSPWGWGVLFLAGSYFVIAGLYQILRGRG